MNISRLFKKYLLSRITVFLVIIFSITVKANAASSTTPFTPTTYSYTQTNYTNVILNIVNQYTNPSESSASEGNGGLKRATYRFIKVNPLTNIKQCFSSNWSVAEVSSSSAFIPQIQVTYKLVISCLGFKGKLVLNGYGQCGFLGPIRVCARVTPPCAYGNNFCCSNDNCSSSDSCPNCSQQKDSRVCAFEDPMFPADPTDIKAGSMPFHKETVVPSSLPSGDSLIVLGAFILAAGLLVPGLGQGTMLIGAGIMLAGGIMELLQFISTKINYVVVSNHGCVDIPLTPFPPPYCPSIPGFIPQASLMSICQQSPDFSNNILATNYQNYTYASTISSSLSYPANTQVSTQEMNCEIASYNNLSLYSTFENPVVRISFDNPLPKCKSGYSGNLDVCVFTNSLNDPLNIWYNSKNLLPVCSSSITTNCISFPSGLSTNAKFRPLYNMTNTDSLGISGASTTNVNFSVLSTYPNWLSSISSSLVFSGINYSNFIDASPGNLVSIIDYTGLRRYFVVYLNDIGDKVCVAERVGNSTSATYISTNPAADIPLLPNCVDRPTMMQKPTITACNSIGTNNCSYSGSFSTASCFTGATCPFSGTSNLTTTPRIQFSIGQTASNANYSSSPKTGIIEVNTALPYNSGANSPTYQAPQAFCVVDDISAYNSTSGTVTSSDRNCSLYGYSAFTAYVTDIYNRTSQNLSSSNQTITPNYDAYNLNTAGAQFTNGYYCRGATQICLDGYQDPTKTVVAKVIMNNISSSSGSSSGTITETYTASNITSDRVIPVYNSSIPNQVLTSFFNPATQYQTASQPASRVAIGTYNSTNQVYVENSYCTTDSNNYCQANGTPTANSPVSTTCTCTGGGTTQTCTITGCDKAFITYTTNSSIEIGQYTNGSYSKNSYCTENSDYYCQAPCESTGTCASPFTPVAASCKCYQNCAQHCKTGSLTSSGYCNVSGCEYAFQQSYSSSITSASYYVSSSGNTYPISGSSSCPNQYSTSTGGSTCSGSNCPCYTTRAANPIELGLCTSIAQPSCPATNYTSASDSGAYNDGYANWPTTTLGTANLNITGTCITGTTQSPNGAPKRSCTYINTGYETIANSSGTLVQGCPKYKVEYGAVTNSCIPRPLWWPSQFLVNQDIRGAIFNHFNINYDYINAVRPLYNNYSQYGKAKEDWVSSNVNNCQYNYDYTMNVARNQMNGDQEMLFITASNWNQFLIDQYTNLQWLFATPSNIPSSASYSSYNGCYVYNVTNYLSVTSTPTITVGMKICKYNDYISFSLVDMSSNSSKSYTNNAYIMQSNLLDYLGSQSANNYNITNDTGKRFINHGIVVYRPGFTSTSFASAPPPSDFVPIQTAESVDLTYRFYNNTRSHNRQGGNDYYHRECNFNKYLTRNNGNPGCALLMHRTALTYNYPFGNNVALECTTDACSRSLDFNSSAGYYIPTASNRNNYSLNNTNRFGNYYYFAGDIQADYFDSYTCTTNVSITNYVAGNSANNPSMFYWTSPNNYSPCHPSYSTVNPLTSNVRDNDMNNENCLSNYN